MNSEITTEKRSIRYTLTMDDLVAFNEFHSSISKGLILKRKRQEAVGAVLLCVVGFVLGIRMYQTTALGFWIVPFDTILPLGLCLVLTNLFKKSLVKFARKNTIKCFQESKGKDFIGELKLSVNENGIWVSSKYSETRLAWGAIDKIEADRDHTYFYIGAANALIIPHNNITEGDLPALLQAIKTHYKPDQELIV